MSSIYNNTSRLDKGKGRSSPVARRGGGPMRAGVGPQRALQQHQLQQQQQQFQEELTYNEFQLTSTPKHGQNHLMDFKSNKKVEPSNFARPVKLHRKESNFIPYRQYIQNLNEQNAANAASVAAAAAKAAAIMAGTPIPSEPQNKNVEDLGESSTTSTPNGTPTPNNKEQHGPKTGADTSLIAPLGGATRNKQMLFKKRTKQIYLAKEDTRELKEQEHRPWILEDYDSQNSFTGTLEGGQRSDYMFFVLTDNGFKVMPVDRWYKFQAKRNFKTLSLEEAEEQLKKQQKRENGRWMMLKRESEQADALATEGGSVGGSSGGKPSKFKIVDHDHTKGGSDDEGKNRNVSLASIYTLFTAFTNIDKN
jgi:transcription initiation factor TFIIF subunit alpha